MKEHSVATGAHTLAPTSSPVLAQGRSATLSPPEREVRVREEILPLRIPGDTIGATERVSMNAVGQLFVLSRTGWSESSRWGEPGPVVQLDRNLQFVKEGISRRMDHRWRFRCAASPIRSWGPPTRDPPCSCRSTRRGGDGQMTTA